MRPLTQAILICVLVGSITSSGAQQTQEPTERLLRHVVLFKFKAETSGDTLDAIREAFLTLPSKIPGIHDMEWGLNNSPEGLNKELTHCFMLTFTSEADRDAYLPHPDHVAFTELAGPHIEDVLVVDYWTGGPR